MLLPPPWDTYELNHENVKIAFLNHCRRIIEFFDPDYLAIGIEVNLYMKLVPDHWDDYMELHRYVYQELKKDYPGLPIMVSLTGMDLISGHTDADHDNQMKALNDIEDYSDFFEVSLYPYISALLTDPIPDDLFDEIFSLSSKLMCICESGYPAEELSVFDGSLVFNGTKKKQNNFFKKLFKACDDYEAEFIINFVLRYYDALWESMGSPDDSYKVWRDTGLYDQDGRRRPASRIWRLKLRKRVVSYNESTEMNS